MHTPSVEIKNMELTLEGIRADSQDAANQLSDILRDIRHAQSELAALNAEARSEKERIAEERNKLQTDQMALDGRKLEWERGTVARQKEIDVLAEQRKAGMRDLHNINQWIFNANEEYERKQAELNDIKTEIQAHAKLAERGSALTAEIADLESKRTASNVEYSLARDNSLVALKDLEWKQERAAQLAKTALEQSLAAENDRQKTIQEKERIRKDLDIYIKRIEAHYQKAFPGLRMIL